MTSLQICFATHFLERHVFGFTAVLLDPIAKEFDITSGDVIGVGKMNLAGDAVDPFRLTFDLAEVADRSFIEHYVSGSVGPLTAKLFVAEGRLVTDAVED